MIVCGQVHENPLLSAFLFQDECTVPYATLKSTFYTNALHINYRVIIILVTEQAASLHESRPNTNYTLTMHSVVSASARLKK